MQSIELLKGEVEKKFARKIFSLTDCRKLHNVISSSRSAKISFSSVQGFFNLAGGDKHPSVNTLNALSNYCGFSSFDNFINSRETGANTNQEKQEKVLLSFLTLFFRQIEVAKKNDFTYLRLVQQTILHLENYPAIIDRFQREIAGTKNGQGFYYEQFLFIDKLNYHYGKGLQYYLNEKKTKEAQLFGHSLLCLGCWLSNNLQGVEKHYKKVMLYKIDKTISNSITARYFASQLFYADAFGLDALDILAKIRAFYLTIDDCWTGYSYLTCFEIILSEALILIGRYQEAMFYICELNKKIKRSIPPYIDIALSENISIFKAIVYTNTRKKRKAFHILCDIDPCKFSFLSRQYLNILYLSARQMIKNRKEDEAQIEQLIQETGFVRL